MKRLVIIEDENDLKKDKNTYYLSLNNNVTSRHNLITVNSIVDLYSNIVRNKYNKIINNFASKFDITNDFSVIYPNRLNSKNLKSFALLFSDVLEKNNTSKSKYINQIIQLMAVEVFLKKNNFTHIENKIKNVLIKNQIEILINDSHEIKNTFSIFLKFIIIFKALVWLFFYVLKIFFLKIFIKNYASTKNNINFFTYINKPIIDNGNFSQLYWGGIDKIFYKKNKKMSYVIAPQTLDSEIDFFKVIFFANKNKNKNILFIESYLTFRNFIFILFYFFKSLVINFNHKITITNNNLSKIDLNHFYFYDFARSLYGITFLKNVINYYCFLNFYKKSNVNLSIFIPFENQTWEKILCFVSSNYKVEIYGSIHNFVCFWDLRFLPLRSSSFYNKLLPKKIITNGNLSRKNLLSMNYTAGNLLAAEALRFNNIYKRKFKFKIDHKLKKSSRILFLFDGNVENSKFQLSLLNNIDLNKISTCKIYLREHPSNIFLYKHKLTHEYVSQDYPLFKIINNFDGVIASNESSVFIYSLINKIPFALIINPDNLNLNPLYKIRRYKLIYNINDIYSFLNKLPLRKKYKFNPFEINNKLTLWNKIVDNIFNK